MKASKHYDAVASLHIRDLFQGSYGGPRPGRKAQAAKKKAFAPPPREIKPPKHFAAIECPCCKKPVGVPDLGVLIDYYEIPAQEAAILRAVWKGKGHPVPNERIFDLMYEDDPDGGPSPASMYSALKVSLHYLRKRLKGSGVSIETVGYRRGFRLVITGA